MWFRNFPTHGGLFTSFLQVRNLMLYDELEWIISRFSKESIQGLFSMKMILGAVLAVPDAKD